jgi:hypothetical protein
MVKEGVAPVAGLGVSAGGALDSDPPLGGKTMRSRGVVA